MSLRDVLPLLLCLLLLLGVWLYQCSRIFHFPLGTQGSHRSHVPHRLRPRSPLDCPECCQASTPAAGKEPKPAPVRLWREVKSRRGAPSTALPRGELVR